MSIMIIRLYAIYIKLIYFIPLQIKQNTFMKKLVILSSISLIIALLFNSSRLAQTTDYLKVDADSLVGNIAIFDKHLIETQGKIIHVCGVDGKKMKLLTNNKSIIKIEPSNKLVRFDDSLYGKTILVRGMVLESRLSAAGIENHKNEKALLCHIDHSPCKDSIWVDKKIKSGASDSISAKDIRKLKNKMTETQKDYISVITIVADSYEVLDLPSN